MNEAYNEYAREHPEELANVKRLLKHSKMVDRERKGRKEDAIRQVEKWRAILNGTNEDRRGI